MSEKLFNNSIKILQIPSWYPPNGGEFCRDQAVCLKQAGVNIDVLATTMLPLTKYKFGIFKYPIKPFFSEEDGINVFRKYFWKIPRNEKLNRKRWIRITLNTFEQYISKKGQPDIIHVHASLWAGYVAYLIKVKYGIPYVVTEHNGIFGHSSQYTQQKLKPEYNPYLTKIFSNADYILPVGSQQIEKIENFISNKNDCKIEVLSNIIDVDLFAFKKRTRNENFVFFAANGFHYYKAYDILFQAFDIVCEENLNIKLRIAGGGFQGDEFQKLMRKSLHADKIFFCGLLSLEGVRNELWKADAFVLPSRAESQSIAVAEALSTGLPVVCTEVVPPEVVGREQGYRVPVDNPEALADAMLKMAETIDSFYPELISQQAQQMANKETFVSKTKKIYNIVLKRND